MTHIFDQDELRFGTRTELKRRWTRQGVRPKTPVKIAYEYSYLYCAICPYDGTLFSAILPTMEKACFKAFITHFCETIDNQATQKDHILMVLDGATNHKASWEKADIPVDLLKIPPACPELNPVERFFKEIRVKLANRIYETIEDVEKRLIDIIKMYESNMEMVKNITHFPYIK